MGSLTIKNKILRCETCFMLKKITIEPNYPQTNINFQCSCGSNRQSIISFTKDLQKEEVFKIKCSFCGKEAKHPQYCTGCRRTYCNVCVKSHDTSQETKTPHELIDSYKYDFYCSKHQDQLVNAHCMTCFLNICQICINDKLHKSHRFIKFSKILLQKKDEEKLKANLKIHSDLLDANITRCNNILSLNNNEEKIKEIREVCNTTTRENRAILALIKYFYKIYTESKHKNYAIIFNITDNIKFNIQPSPSDDVSSIEQRTSDFIEYLKREFVIFKRFNSITKARSNTTMPNSQMNFLKKKINKPELKEENKNDNDGKKPKIENDEIPKQERNYTVTNRFNNQPGPSSNMFSVLGIEKKENDNNNNNNHETNNNQVGNTNNTETNNNEGNKIIEEDKEEEEEGDTAKNQKEEKTNNNPEVNIEEQNKDDNIVNINEIIANKDKNPFTFDKEEEIKINFDSTPSQTQTQTQSNTESIQNNNDSDKEVNMGHIDFNENEVKNNNSKEQKENINENDNLIYTD